MRIYTKFLYIIYLLPNLLSFFFGYLHMITSY